MQSFSRFMKNIFSYKINSGIGYSPFTSKVGNFCHHLPLLTKPYSVSNPKLMTNGAKLKLPSINFFFSRGMATLYQMHRRGPVIKPPRKKLSDSIDGRPQMKGIVLRTLIKKPKKPNSANRKCIQVRLTNKKIAFVHLPGVGHNLQEHNSVLVRPGKLQDVPGVRLKAIRGKYDFDHVVKK